MSWGDPKCRAVWRDIRTSYRRIERGSAGTTSVCELAMTPSGRRQLEMSCGDRTAHELVGSRGNGLDDDAVSLTPDRIDAEHHPAQPRVELGLNENGHGQGPRALISDRPR